MLNRIALSLFAILLLISCQDRFNRSPRANEKGSDLLVGILGGTTLSPNDGMAKSTVIVFQMKPDGSVPAMYCSGSIITPNIVITAAHCVFSEETGPLVQPQQMMIYLGNYLRKDDFDLDREIKVSAIRVHPSYDSKFLEGHDAHDLALLKLSENVKFDFRPANILRLDRKINVKDRISTAGYGINVINDKKQDLVLHSFSKYIVTSITSSMVRLSSQKNRGNAGGDSGGPGFLIDGGEPLLWGVFSSYDAETYSFALFQDFRIESSWLNEVLHDFGSELRL